MRPASAPRSAPLGIRPGGISVPPAPATPCPEDVVRLRADRDSQRNERDALRVEVHALRAEVERLRQQLAALQARGT
jgi:predicted  nucleic acid-binding Zn-ribbon protein